MNALDDDRLWTFEQAADHLNVSESTLRRMIANRDITAIRIGGRPGGLIRIRPSALQEATRGWQNR